MCAETIKEFDASRYWVTNQYTESEVVVVLERSHLLEPDQSGALPEASAADVQVVLADESNARAAHAAAGRVKGGHDGLQSVSALWLSAASPVNLAVSSTNNSASSPLASTLGAVAWMRVLERRHSSF